MIYIFFFFFSSRRRHTRFDCDWSSDVCSSDLPLPGPGGPVRGPWRRLRCCRTGRANSTTDRKSTRLNSSHSQISYAVFCLKKKKKHNIAYLEQSLYYSTTLRLYHVYTMASHC